ncbi:DNA-formamidopyrimidine glycosylase [Lentibacillus sp. JNUCC-1]|uniref:DNA-formamidopyrimidine glycosylase n=1 Tax=Lentibacillus sp. JNUCC-1 TaxID=2654513 RepID=UPI0012E844BF|nr:DNA-formamidopyrimidine glycosylase [Lentibacillus sp. JNUCC-1]MUV39350.1 DNA-formamidopyrimidine glycosylase [Lentibacillus sp. JNUCC-1]
MPELPEVETIKETLKHLVLNKTITKADVYWPKMIKHPDDVGVFKEWIKGQTIQDVKRKGKFLMFQLNDYVLVSHLRMEGKYSVDAGNEPVKKHTHVVFDLNTGEQLRYNDVRKFGTMHLFVKGTELTQKPLNQLGPDPFETTFTVDNLNEKCQKTNRVIKAVLLDQSIVAGLGNIYVDETLFKAQVHPLKPANTLTKKEIADVHAQAIDTLAEAVRQGGTTIRSYVNTQGAMGMFQQKLAVYGQTGQPCPVCGAPVVKLKAAGRGTHICTSCQTF